jgi:putative Mg2+ transporter-C (MgtC) family protein
MGLCFGGGQIGLGLAAFALGFGVLAGLKYLENAMLRDQTATLSVTLPKEGQEKREIEELLMRSAIRPETFRIDYNSADCKVITWNLHWRERAQRTDPPSVIQELSKRNEIQHLEFRR